MNAKNLFKNKFLRIINIYFLCTCLLFAKSNLLTNNKLSELLKAKSFFKIRDELNNSKNNLSIYEKLYYEAKCSEAFNEPQKANEYSDILLTKYKNVLDDSIKLKLLNIKAQYYIRIYQYNKAASIYKTILNNQMVKSDDLVDYQNMYELFSSIKNVKPQIIHRKKSVTFLKKYNKSNNLMIPIECNNKKEEFIFDTGANFSTISESYAKKLNLKIFKSNIKVGTSTIVDVFAKMGVAENIYIGNILFENVVFLVLPDEVLSFPSDNFKINGIIGFPVMNQMGELIINNDTIIIPKILHKKNYKNLFLDGLNPVVKITSKNKNLLFTLDTGATETELSQLYYKKFKEEVEKTGKLKIKKKGGVGGIIKTKTYELTNFPYTIASKSNNLKNIDVVLTEYHFNKDFDGNLGQDILRNFNKIILNFKYMYIELK